MDEHKQADWLALELIYNLAHVYGFSIVVTKPDDVLNVAHAYGKQITKAHARELLETIHNDIADACTLESHHIIEAAITKGNGNAIKARG